MYDSSDDVYVTGGEMGTFVTSSHYFDLCEGDRQCCGYAKTTGARCRRVLDVNKHMRLTSNGVPLMARRGLVVWWRDGSRACLGAFYCQDHWQQPLARSRAPRAKHYTFEKNSRAQEQYTVSSRHVPTARSCLLEVDEATSRHAVSARDRPRRALLIENFSDSEASDCELASPALSRRMQAQQSRTREEELERKIRAQEREKSEAAQAALQRARDLEKKRERDEKLATEARHKAELEAIRAETQASKAQLQVKVDATIAKLEKIERRLTGQALAIQAGPSLVSNSKSTKYIPVSTTELSGEEARNETKRTTTATTQTSYYEPTTKQPAMITVVEQQQLDLEANLPEKPRAPGLTTRVSNGLRACCACM